MFRCQILINGISYEATDDLKNWDDFGISQKRSNYDGVIRSFSTQFEFVNRSYELLKEEFEQHYLSAKAAIVFYLRNNSWNWDKIFHCTLILELIRKTVWLSLSMRLTIISLLSSRQKGIFCMNIR